MGRLAVEALGSAAWRLRQQQPAAALLRAVLQLKRLLGASRCAAVVSVSAGRPSAPSCAPQKGAVRMQCECACGC